jgi:hypothetical protein
MEMAEVPMPERVTVYEVSWFPWYRAADGSGRETQQHNLYTADSQDDAIGAALRLVLHSFKACGKSYEWQGIGCVKISFANFGPVDKHGYPYNDARFPFFEWKLPFGLNRPARVSEEAHIMLAQIKALNPKDYYN